MRGWMKSAATQGEITAARAISTSYVNFLRDGAGSGRKNGTARVVNEWAWPRDIYGDAGVVRRWLGTRARDRKEG